MGNIISKENLWERNLGELIGVIIRFTYEGKVYSGEITDADIYYYFIDVSDGLVKENKAFDHSLMEDIEILKDVPNVD